MKTIWFFLIVTYLSEFVKNDIHILYFCTAHTSNSLLFVDLEKIWTWNILSITLISCPEFVRTCTLLLSVPAIQIFPQESVSRPCCRFNLGLLYFKKTRPSSIIAIIVSDLQSPNTISPLCVAAKCTVLDSSKLYFLNICPFFSSFKMCVLLQRTRLR